MFAKNFNQHWHNLPQDPNRLRTLKVHHPATIPLVEQKPALPKAKVAQKVGCFAERSTAGTPLKSSGDLCFFQYHKIINHCRLLVINHLQISFSLEVKRWGGLGNLLMCIASLAKNGRQCTTSANKRSWHKVGSRFLWASERPLGSLQVKESVFTLELYLYFYFLTS